MVQPSRELPAAPLGITSPPQLPALSRRPWVVYTLACCA